jgi:hypothetical protein
LAGLEIVVAHDLATHTPVGQPLGLFTLQPPAFVFLSSSSSLIFLLAFLLSAPQHKQAFLSHAPLLGFPFLLAISESLHAFPFLYPGHLACLHLQHRLLVSFVHHQASVGQKETVEIVILDCGNARIVIRSDLNALEP